MADRTYADILRYEAYELDLISSPTTGGGDGGPRLRKRAAHLRSLADLLDFQKERGYMALLNLLQEAKLIEVVGFAGSDADLALRYLCELQAPISDS